MSRLSKTDVMEMIAFAWKAGRVSSMANLCEWLESDVEIVRPLVIRLSIANRIERNRNGKGWKPAGVDAPKPMQGEPLPYA